MAMKNLKIESTDSEAFTDDSPKADIQGIAREAQTIVTACMFTESPWTFAGLATQSEHDGGFARCTR
jgi:hypothetical protein